MRYNAIKMGKEEGGENEDGGGRSRERGMMDRESFQGASRCSAPAIFGLMFRFFLS